MHYRSPFSVRLVTLRLLSDRTSSGLSHEAHNEMNDECLSRFQDIVVELLHQASSAAVVTDPVRERERERIDTKL